tara:strand:- start:376 stop:735 length:360 start_codon:yes stop_codon:yes gene_type:complete
MAYEMYICLDKATYESAIPSALSDQLKVTKYTYDSDGEVASTSVDTSPTWKEAAFDGKLGIPRESHDGAYIIVKGAFSLLKGEMTAIVALGASKSYPSNSVLTKAEAKTLVRSGTFTGE